MKMLLEISDRLAGAPGWWSCVDRRQKRAPRLPMFIALHPGAGILLAVYARPWCLQPAELPTLGPLPPGWLAAVWRPRMAEMRAGGCEHRWNCRRLVVAA